MMSLKKSIYSAVGKLFYPKLKNREYINSTLFKFIFWQKICRINSKAGWPVHFTSKIIEPSKISVSENFRPLGMAVGNYIDARNGIVVEDNVHVGPQVAIISCNHSISNYSEYDSSQPVVLHRNCWLAAGCKILAGVELGEHTVVGAGSVVTHSFTEGNVLIAGNPAKVIRSLPPYKND